jgi:hypothetical protein
MSDEDLRGLAAYDQARHSERKDGARCRCGQEIPRGDGPCSSACPDLAKFRGPPTTPRPYFGPLPGWLEYALRAEGER